MLLPPIRALRLMLAIVAAALHSLCVFSAATAQERLEPSDIWYRGFDLVQLANDMEAQGRPLEALNKLNEAKPLYDHLAEQFPDFQPEIVRERRQLIVKKCEELKISGNRWGVWMTYRIPSPDLLTRAFRGSEWRNDGVEDRKPIVSYIAIGIGPFGAVYLSPLLSSVLLILFVASVATLILKRKHRRGELGANGKDSPATS